MPAKGLGGSPVPVSVASIVIVSLFHSQISSLQYWNGSGLSVGGGTVSGSGGGMHLGKKHFWIFRPSDTSDGPEVNAERRRRRVPVGPVTVSKKTCKNVKF